MEIVPLPEPQFLSSPPTKYPTLGRPTSNYTNGTLGRGHSNRVARNHMEYSSYSTPSPCRDNVVRYSSGVGDNMVRYSTIGRQRVSPTGGPPPPSSPNSIYAPGSTYSSGGASNHSSFLDSDLANPRSLTLSNRSDFPLFE